MGYNLATMNGMHRHLRPILFGIILSITCKVPADAGTGVRLAYVYEPGSTYRYKIKQQVKGTREITGSQPVQIDVELTSIIRLKCNKQLPDGAIEVAVDTEDEWMKISGKAVYGYRPSKEVRTFQILPSGRTIASSTEGGTTRRRRSGIDFGNVESVILMAIMPETPVDIGATWSSEMPLPLDTKSTLKLAFKLEEIKSLNGSQLAVIRQSISTVASEETGEGNSAAKGSQSGEMTLLFDIAKGRLNSAQGSIRTQVTRPVEVPSMPGSKSDERFYETVDLTSNLTVEEAPTSVKDPTSQAR